MSSTKVLSCSFNYLAKNCRQYVLLLCVLFASTVQSATDLDLVFSGFGSLAYTRGSSDISKFRRDNSYEGADRSGSLIVDSRAGVQLDSYFSERFSATVQVLARQDDEGDFKPRIEWAFLNSQITDNLSLRVGRISNPLFMNSQVRDVGYAYMKLRLAEVIYTTSPLSNFYGLDITRYFPFENSDVTTQFYAGVSKTYFPDSLVVEAKKLFGFFLSEERNNIRWRAGYAYLGVEVDAITIRNIGETLGNIAEQFPEVQPTVDEFTVRERPAHVYNLGVEVDLAPWYFSAEWQTLDAAALIFDANSWFATVGYRFDRISPFLSFSSARQSSKTFIENPSVPALDPLYEAISVLYRTLDQDTFTLGVRWDFARKLSLTTQLDIFKKKGDGYVFTFAENGEVNNIDVAVFGISLDYIF